MRYLLPQNIWPEASFVTVILNKQYFFSITLTVFSILIKVLSNLPENLHTVFDWSHVYYGSSVQYSFAKAFLNRLARFFLWITKKLNGFMNNYCSKLNYAFMNCWG